jgi:hypothetical protein
LAPGVMSDRMLCLRRVADDSLAALSDEAVDRYGRVGQEGTIVGAARRFSRAHALNPPRAAAPGATLGPPLFSAIRARRSGSRCGWSRVSTASGWRRRPDDSRRQRGVVSARPGPASWTRRALSPSFPQKPSPDRALLALPALGVVDHFDQFSRAADTALLGPGRHSLRAWAAARYSDRHATRQSGRCQAIG